ncbi:MAG: hypothetical protein IPM29_17345 [Planctomycetes bacterium]|nr:hypothetical protein [Planctomycetota bacterium]
MLRTDSLISTTALAAVTLVAGVLRAQDPQPNLPEGSITDFMRPAVVNSTDGELWASQARWKAQFAPDGVVFVPTLGPLAPRSLPVRFRLAEILHGERSVLPPTKNPRSVQPTLDGNTVRYVHDTDVVETYEVIEDGIEQSFVFPTRLPGQGDLVVRLSLDTELTAEVGHYDDGLTLHRDGEPLVGIGRVVGIDARGRRCAGELRWDGSQLELVLPAAFVDTARYPLVLDPLIGPLGRHGNGAILSDVAYDVTWDLYLVVWQHTVSASDRDVYGQRVRQNGTTVGTRVNIENGVEDMYAAKVANVNLRDMFYAVMEFDSHDPNDGKQIIGRAVTAASGSSLRQFLLHAGNLVPSRGPLTEGIQPDVCGDRTLADDACMVVFADPYNGIQSREISIDVNGDPTIVRSRQLTGFTAARRPRTCNSGGDARRLFVVWEEAPSYIAARALSLDSTFLSSVALIAGNSSATLPVGEPVVDGNGENFLCVYRRQEPGNSSSTGIWTIDLRVPSSPGAVWAFTRQAELEDTPNQREESPAVTFVQNGANPSRRFFGVSWGEVFPGRGDVVAVLTNARGEACGPIDTLKPFCANGGFASTYTGGRNDDDRAMAAMWDGPFAFTQGWEAFGPGGPIVDLGGGCGQGGTLTANGPMALGNPDWGLRLTGANNGGSTISVLAIDVSLAPGAPILACNTCRALLPTFTVDIPIANGGTFVPIAVICDPNALGTTLRSQFWTLTPSAPPTCYWGSVAFSNILETTHGR